MLPETTNSGSRKLKKDRNMTKTADDIAMEESKKRESTSSNK